MLKEPIRETWLNSSRLLLLPILSPKLSWHLSRGGRSSSRPKPLISWDLWSSPLLQIISPVELSLCRSQQRTRLEGFLERKLRQLMASWLASFYPNRYFWFNKVSLQWPVIRHAALTSRIDMLTQSKFLLEKIAGPLVASLSTLAITHPIDTARIRITMNYHRKPKEMLFTGITSAWSYIRLE